MKLLELNQRGLAAPATDDGKDPIQLVPAAWWLRKRAREHRWLARASGSRQRIPLTIWCITASAFSNRVTGWEYCILDQPDWMEILRPRTAQQDRNTACSNSLTGYI
ncbi:hypothetical protein PMIN02_007704 [Paraphaeosphaeria minitans]